MTWLVIKVINLTIIYAKHNFYDPRPNKIGLISKIYFSNSSTVFKKMGITVKFILKKLNN